MIQLYQRCRDRRVLPQAGGLFDQPEALMTAFDTIDAVIATYRQNQVEEDKAKAAHDEALRRLQRG